MDPRKLRHDLQRIERRLGELDAERESGRDVAAEAMSILRRPKPQEEHPMSGNYFAGGDGKRRTFNSDGTETTPGAQPPTQRPTPGSSTPNLARPVAAASPRASTPQPGAQGTFTGSNGVVRQLRPDGSLTGTGTSTGGAFSAMSPSTSSPSLARPVPQPGRQHQQPAVNLTRPTYSPTTNPVTAATSVPFDEAVRRAENASSDFHLRGNTKTRSQREQILANQSTMRNFWLDQAKSIPGAAQRMAEYQAEQGSAERIAGTEAATAMQRTQAENDARLQGIGMQERGAMDRTNAEGQFQLRRPQRPITLSDGSLAAPGPDGTLQPYTLPDGSPALAQMDRPQVNQAALARLVPALAEQFSGIDEYGQVADPEAPKGRRAATAEDREAAYRRAVSAARETLAGPSNPQPSQQRPATSASPPAGSRPATLDEFLSRAREANPSYSDEELSAYFTQSYGSR